MKLQRYAWFLCCLLVTLTCVSATVRADLFTVSLDTSSLAANPGSGPYAIEFQFFDVAGTSIGNNTATVSNFSFGGGSPVGTPTLGLGVTGSLAGTITMTDQNPMDYLDPSSYVFLQTFSPGSLLSFNVSLTANIALGEDVAGDNFSFLLHDADGPLATLPFGFPGPLVSVDITSSDPPIQTYQTDPTQSPGGVGLVPSVSTTVAVPEPSTLYVALAGFGLIGLLARRR